MEDCIKDDLWDDIKVYCPNRNEVISKKAKYNRLQYIDSFDTTSTRVKVNEEYVDVMCKDFDEFVDLSICYIKIDSDRYPRWYKIRDTLYQSSSIIRIMLKKCKENIDPVVGRKTELMGFNKNTKKSGRKRVHIATEVVHS